MNIDKKEKATIVARVTWTGLLANLFLFVIKLAFGIVGGSGAVVADAFHSLSDIFTDLGIIIGVKYWSKPADQDHPHGHYKIEILVTFGIGVLLAAVATGILWNAVQILHEHEADANPPTVIALIAALISIAIKEILYRWTVHIGKNIKSLALIANAWHHRSDAFSSLPAALAVSVAIFYPSWEFIDHIGALVISLFIYGAAYKIIRPSLWRLVDTGVGKKELARIQNIILSIEGVRNVHNMRTRYKGATDIAVDFHMEVDGHLKVCEAQEIYRLVKVKLLESDLSITDVTVHIEPVRNPISSTNASSQFM